MSGTTALGFVYPTSGDPMCAAPGFLPVRTALDVLGDSVNDWMAATLQPDADRLIDGFPRVKVSRQFFDNTKQSDSLLTTFDTLDFNVGTATDLALNNTGVVLDNGTWVVIHEVTWTTTTQVIDGQLINQDSGPVVQAQYTGEPVLGGGQNVVDIVRIGYPQLATSFINPIHSGANTGTFFTYHAMTAIKVADFF